MRRRKLYIYMLFPSTVQAIIMKAKREIKEYHDSDNNDNVAVMMIMRRGGGGRGRKFIPSQL